MSPRIAWILIATLALPSLAFAHYIYRELGGTDRIVKKIK